MKKKRNAPRTLSAPDRGKAAAGLAVCAALYFLAVGLCTASNIKLTAIVLTALTLASAFLFFTRLRDRIGVPLLLLAAVVIMDGISTLYAVSGKFALYEFLKVLAAFCLVLTLLAVAPERDTGRWIAKVLAGFSAVSGLVSIDMISTRFLSGAVIGFFNMFSQDYAYLGGVEAGVRMTSIFENPNVFAGVAGSGVLLSLGLACSSESKRERTVQTVILYVNSLSFLLAFSMGASASIALAFLVFLLLERRERRMGLLILMVETLIFTVLSAAVISMTSFDVWDGVQPVPLICTALGAAALCASDAFLGGRVTKVLGKHGKLIPILVGSVLAVMAVFVLAAYNLTGGVALDEGGTLRRAAYPEPGRYTLEVSSDRPLEVTVESQNEQDTMMHTSSVLYSGPAEGASFDVPDGSLVLYFNFYAPEGADLTSAAYTGENGGGDIPLGYKLLPGFMANRLQGLWANENAIQRLVFFGDGLKLFRRSPVFGLGLGAFENGIKSVQSFAYVTKYAHNHYIQTLAETGIVGLVLLLALFGGSGAAVALERKRGAEAHRLVPALGAGVTYMAAHAFTEVVFSSYPYLPIAFGVFGLVSVCCGEALKPALRKTAKTIALLAICLFLVIYALLLVYNLHARAVVESSSTFDALDEAIAMDKFEWADYALSYVDSADNGDVSGEIRARADKYAARLEKIDSNTVPIYLAEYYFNTGRTEKAMEMILKYVDYVSSDQTAWQSAFDLMLAHEDGTAEFKAGVLGAARMLDEWNEANMGKIVLNDEAAALIDRMRQS